MKANIQMRVDEFIDFVTDMDGALDEYNFSELQDGTKRMLYGYDPHGATYTAWKLFYRLLSEVSAERSGLHFDHMPGDEGDE